MSGNSSGSTFIELTAEIVSAYVSNNSVPSSDLSALINQVHSALTRVSSGQVDAPSPIPGQPCGSSGGRFHQRFIRAHRALPDTWAPSP